MKDNLSLNRLQNIPEELKRCRQWVGWKPGKPRKNGKMSKIPLNPFTRKEAKVNDPESRGTFQDALNLCETSKVCQGIGFIFVNGYIGIDLDDCFESSGKMTRSAERILSLIDSYAEMSQSSTGLHIIVKGEKPTDMICKIGTEGGGEIEVYDQGRFFVMTGNVFNNRRNITEADLSSFFQEFFPIPPGSSIDTPGETSAICLDDLTILEKANAAKDGATFARLWSGDVSGFRSESEADFALCRQLAFWSGNNADIIDRLFRQSGLMRKKWNEKHGSNGNTYGAITIANAIKRTTKIYDPGYNSAVHPPHPADVTPAAQPRDPEQEEHEEPFFITHNTDMGNAQRLVKNYGHKIRYCVDHNSWYVWKKRYWKPDPKNANLVKIAKKTVKRIYSECETLDDSTERKNRAKWAQQSEDKKRITDMIFLAQTEDGIELDADEMDADRYLLNVKNGVIDLRTGELKPHDPAYLMTKYVPIDYDPTADCPIWEEAIFKYMGYKDGDPESEDRALRLHDYLQRAVGYSLTGDVSEQCLFFLHGDGKNGKSTFINALSKLMGDYFQHVRIESLMVKKNETIPNDIAKLPGARLVISSEIPENRKLNETLVKDMTGGDAITARFLRQEEFTFYPVFKLWIFGNDKPIVSPSDAMFRRIHLIPFDVQIPESERDPHFDQKLQKELSGLLRWAVIGCRQWLKQGLNPPQEIIDATNAYRDEMDILSDFLEECCIIKPLAQVTVKGLYDEFRKWGESSGRSTIGKMAFNKRLQKRLPQIDKRPGNRNATTWFGLGLLSEQQQTLDYS